LTLAVNYALNLFEGLMTYLDSPELSPDNSAAERALQVFLSHCRWVGYCKLNRQETLLFFQLVDRIRLKDTGSIVLTSNKDLSQWPEVFDEDDTLECAIDRLWDKAICMTFSGQSHRGSDRDQIELNFLKFR
jgi:hypothetical protein